MNDSVKKFSFFGLPLRVFNLEKLVESLTGNTATIEALQNQVSELETQLTNLTERVDEIENPA